MFENLLLVKELHLHKLIVDEKEDFENHLYFVK